MASAYYDLSARFDPAQFKDITDAQRRVMLQALLADRFKLVVRRETKILPHFALVIAKGGPKMQETKAETSRGTTRTNCTAAPASPIFANAQWQSSPTTSPGSASIQLSKTVPALPRATTLR
jgi:uncharacterized protein (TIGR03435 family)